MKLFFIIIIPLLSGTIHASNETDSINPERYTIIFRNGISTRTFYYLAINSLFTGNSSPWENFTTTQITTFFRLHARNQTELLNYAVQQWNEYARSQGWLPHDPGLFDREYQSHLYHSIDELIARGTRPSVIISSPYLSSIQTAEIIQQRFRNEGIELEILIDRRLQEWPHLAFTRQGMSTGEAMRAINQLHIPRANYRDITPSGWTRLTLVNELFETSQWRYMARIQRVIREYSGQHARPLIVGHESAIYSLIGDENLEEIEHGAHVLFSAATRDSLHPLTISHSGVHFNSRRSESVDAEASSRLSSCNSEEC